TDRENDPLTYVLNSTQASAAISAQGLITWIPTEAGETTMDVTVSDGNASQRVDWPIQVLDANVPLTLDLSILENFVDEGDTVSISAIPNGMAGPYILDIQVDGVTVSNTTSVDVVATGQGVHTVRATVNDGNDETVETVSFFVRDPSDIVNPVASISAPLTETVVTGPIEILGTASDANLFEWKLYYRSRSATEWQEFHSSTSNVTDGVLATFDPTVLLNGLYDIVLEVTDRNGAKTSDNIVVSVEGNLKIGHFTHTVEDLNIAVEGIPIQVTRTYDTRRRHEDLDFGYGWSIDYQNIRVDESRALGAGWVNAEADFNFCTNPLGAPIVTVTLPNGDTEKFSVSVTPECVTGSPRLDVNLQFTAVGDTQSTLELTNDELVRL
ncbi:MAG: hypothetical protein MI867_21345, partial [Pseudomonadales bacterium]|nr:hypothetical protein [Pseudomonadales bacterium]